MSSSLPTLQALRRDYSAVRSSADKGGVEATTPNALRLDQQTELSYPPERHSAESPSCYEDVDVRSLLDTILPAQASDAVLEDITNVDERLQVSSACNGHETPPDVHPPVQGKAACKNVRTGLKGLREDFPSPDDPINFEADSANRKTKPGPIAIPYIPPPPAPKDGAIDFEVMTPGAERSLRREEDQADAKGESRDANGRWDASWADYFGAFVCADTPDPRKSVRETYPTHDVEGDDVIEITLGGDEWFVSMKLMKDYWCEVSTIYVDDSTSYGDSAAESAPPETGAASRQAPVDPKTADGTFENAMVVFSDSFGEPAEHLVESNEQAAAKLLPDVVSSTSVGMASTPRREAGASARVSESLRDIKPREVGSGVGSGGARAKTCSPQNILDARKTQSAVGSCPVDWGARMSWQERVGEIDLESGLMSPFAPSRTATDAADSRDASVDPSGGIIGNADSPFAAQSRALTVSATPATYGDTTSFLERARHLFWEAATAVKDMLVSALDWFGSWCSF